MSSNRSVDSTQESATDDKLFLLESKVRTLEMLFRERDREMREKFEEDRLLTKKDMSETSVDLSYADGNDVDLSPSSSLTTSLSFFVPRSIKQHSPSQGQLRRSHKLFEQSTMLRPDMVRRPSVIEEELDIDDDYKDLSQDTFSLMILAKPFSFQWLFGFLTFLLQICLLLMIVIDQYSSSKGTTPFDIPYKVDKLVHVGQFLALMLSLATQTDLVMSILTFMMLWTERRVYWTKLIKVPENASLWIWLTRIAFPIACEFLEGLFVLISTFVIVIQSSDIIDLFKDFAAMQLISEFDNMMFWLALHGYMGTSLSASAKQARKIRVHDDVIKAYGGIPLRTIILLLIGSLMISGWSYIVHGQVTGQYFDLKYPTCNLTEGEIFNMGNGKCDGGNANSIACGFDDGDCIAFNLAYPNCKIKEPIVIGDGVCNQEYNTKDCLYDGGDCCPMDSIDSQHSGVLGDSFCNGGVFNTKACNFDEGDCVQAKSLFPKCEVLLQTDVLYFHQDTLKPLPALGDGLCDGGLFNNRECGWDSGDCSECNSIVPVRSKIGDGYCDGGIYLNEPSCNDDGGDCAAFLYYYPDCNVQEPEKINDGVCDGWPYNTEECGYDGGDCDACNAALNNLNVDFYPQWLGDGVCDGGAYLAKECHEDAGDCSACVANMTIDERRKIGNGVCDLDLNTTECSYDGYDCMDKEKEIPCQVENQDWLGDGICDGGEYNTFQCNYDYGDCLACNDLVDDISKIGDGKCHGGPYNTEICGEDGGDCKDFNENYPDCQVPEPSLVGNGFCDGNIYFTDDCEDDGGDCDSCDVEKPSWVGDGICDGGEYLQEECSVDGGDCNTCIETHEGDVLLRLGDGKCDKDLNTTSCGYDGGDCLENDTKCLVPNGDFLGDGRCNGGIYNTAACNWDDGDCIVCNSKVTSSEFDRIGDGLCDGDILSIDECNLDGNDCIEFIDNYPDCNVEFPSKVGDGICDPSPYFSEDCEWDGGDCDSCAVPDFEKFGNGICDGGAYIEDGCAEDGGDCSECLNLPGIEPSDLGDDYCDIKLNRTECGFDGGDCLGPDLCLVQRKNWLGDNFCDGGEYNTERCNFDYGDCDACNAALEAAGEDIGKIGDGRCDGGLVMTLNVCNKDGGDCERYLNNYPNCMAAEPQRVGDGICDGKLPNYNTVECGWDGGDCLDTRSPTLSPSSRPSKEPTTSAPTKAPTKSPTPSVSSHMISLINSLFDLSMISIPVPSLSPPAHELSNFKSDESTNESSFPSRHLFSNA